MTNKRYDLHSGERQVAEEISNIRPDHVARYQFAIDYLRGGRDGMFVLDCACGCGYGSWMLGKAYPKHRIWGFDISESAIDYANKFYKLENNSFHCADITDLTVVEQNIDVIVSFETIEHIAEDDKLIKTFREMLKYDGFLFLSTPNADNMPYNNHPFHVRHYDQRQIVDLLTTNKMKIEKVVSQETNLSTGFINGWDGLFNILVCRKMGE